MSLSMFELQVVLWLISFSIHKAIATATSTAFAATATRGRRGMGIPWNTTNIWCEQLCVLELGCPEVAKQPAGVYGEDNYSSEL